MADILFKNLFSKFSICELRSEDLNSVPVHGESNKVKIGVRCRGEEIVGAGRHEDPLGGGGGVEVDAAVVLKVASERGRHDVAVHCMVHVAVHIIVLRRLFALDSVTL